MGIHDRHYMRPAEAPRTLPPFHKLLCIVLVATYVVTTGLLAWMPKWGEPLLQHTSLSTTAAKEGELWTLATYAFLHSHVDIWHIVLNVLCLFFIGKSTLALLGERRSWIVFLGGATAGGLAWLTMALVRGLDGATLTGASAGICALLAAFLLSNLLRPVTFFILVFPLTLPGRFFATFFLVIEGLGFVLQELPTGTGFNGIAHSAHLGGFAFGWIATAWWWSDHELLADHKATAWLLPPFRLVKRIFSRKPKSATSKLNLRYKINFSDGKDFEPDKAEVDRILDKINAQGFGSLTQAERDTLDRAHKTRRK